jgi:hypothetical protein
MTTGRCPFTKPFKLFFFTESLTGIAGDGSSVAEFIVVVVMAANRRIVVNRRIQEFTNSQIYTVSFQRGVDNTRDSFAYCLAQQSSQHLSTT